MMDGISDRLLERGAKFYEGGIVMIKTCLITGLVLLVFTLVTTGEDVGEALTFRAYSTFTNILVAAAYLAILASSSVFGCTFSACIIWALGRSPKTQSNDCLK